MRYERPRTGRRDLSSASALLAPTVAETTAARIRPPVGRDPGRPGREHLEPARPTHPLPARHAADPEPEKGLDEPTPGGRQQQIKEAVRAHRGD
jgi:hypothetical protein